MLNIGPGELIIIALVLLIAVGPEQLPSMIRRIGQVAGQARDMTDSLRSEFMSGMEELERATDPNAWAASAGPSPDKPQPAIPGVDKPGKPLEAGDSSDPSDLADTADDEDPVDSVDPADSADDEGPVDSVDPADSADLSGPVDTSDLADPVDPVDPADPVDSGDLADSSDPSDLVDSVDDEDGASETDSSPTATTGTWGPLEAGPAQAEPSRPSDSVAPALSDDNGGGHGNEIPGGDHRGNGAEPVDSVDGDENPKLEESA